MDIIFGKHNKIRITHRITEIHEHIYSIHSIGNSVAMESLNLSPTRQSLRKYSVRVKKALLRSIVTALDVHKAWYGLQRTNLVAYS